MTLDAADIDVTALPDRLPSPAMAGFLTSLEAVGPVLSERAAALGVEIVRGAPVTAVAQDDRTVTATAGGNEVRARRLVGRDGGRSTVRTLTGFDFVGTEPLFTGYIAQVIFADSKQLPLGFHLTPNGMYPRAPWEGYLGMMDFDGGALDRSEPLTREHLQPVLRRITDTDVTLTDVQLASSFTDRGQPRELARAEHAVHVGGQHACARALSSVPLLGPEESDEPGPGREPRARSAAQAARFRSASSAPEHRAEHGRPRACRLPSPSLGQRYSTPNSASLTTRNTLRSTDR